MTDPLDQTTFRGALSRFASGVTVVTTVLDGIDHAMTASAFTSVSLDPPQVLVCSQRTSRFHEAVLESGVWGVSILSDRGRAASAWFAHSGRPLEGFGKLMPQVLLRVRGKPEREGGPPGLDDRQTTRPFAHQS